MIMRMKHVKKLNLLECNHTFDIGLLAFEYIFAILLHKRTGCLDQWELNLLIEPRSYWGKTESYSVLYTYEKRQVLDFKIYLEKRIFIFTQLRRSGK